MRGRRGVGANQPSRIASRKGMPATFLGAFIGRVLHKCQRLLKGRRRKCPFVVHLFEQSRFVEQSFPGMLHLKSFRTNPWVEHLWIKILLSIFRSSTSSLSGSEQESLRKLLRLSCLFSSNASPTMHRQGTNHGNCSLGDNGPVLYAVAGKPDGHTLYSANARRLASALLRGSCWKQAPSLVYRFQICSSSVSVADLVSTSCLWLTVRSRSVRPSCLRMRAAVGNSVNKPPIATRNPGRSGGRWPETDKLSNKKPTDR